MQPLDAAEKAGAAWAQSLDASSPAELRKIAAEKLQDAAQRQRGTSWPITDGWVIPDDQYRLYEAGKYNDVPVLIGYNSDDGTTFGAPRSQEACVQSVHERYEQFAANLLAAYPGDDAPAAKKNRARPDARYNLWLGHLELGSTPDEETRTAATRTKLGTSPDWTARCRRRAIAVNGGKRVEFPRDLLL